MARGILMSHGLSGSVIAVHWLQTTPASVAAGIVALHHVGSY